MGFYDPHFVEYDMDSEDERWLEEYNQGQERLPEGKFEDAIWRLEITNAEATDQALNAAGRERVHRSQLCSLVINCTSF